MNPEITELIEAARAVLGEFSLGNGSSAGSVAVAIKTATDNIYTGICLDLACGIGFCAEHAAVVEMLKSRETMIDTVVAVNKSGILPPCGRCRELMMQIDKRNEDTKVVLNNGRIMLLRELLPEHWLDHKI